MLLLKVLIQVFEKQYPESQPKFYLLYLYANFKEKFQGGTLLRDLMMATQRQSTMEYMKLICLK